MTVLYTILGIIALFFLAQYVMVFKMRFKKGKAVPQLPGRYGNALKKGEKAVFYFYSDNCSACRPMTPLIDKFRKKYPNVYKVNVANDLETARKFGVLGTPSTVFVENGVILEFLVGPQPESRIARLLA